MKVSRRYLLGTAAAIAAASSVPEPSHSSRRKSLTSSCYSWTTWATGSWG